MQADRAGRDPRAQAHRPRRLRLLVPGRSRKARLAHLSVPCICLEARPRRDRPLGLTSLATPSCHGCAPYRTGCRTSRTSTAAASTAGACEPASPSTPEREASPRSYLSATPGSARRTALCCAAWEPERFGPVPCGPLSLGRRLVLVGHGLATGYSMVLTACLVGGGLTGVLHGYSRGYSRGYSTQAVGYDSPLQALLNDPCEYSECPM